MNTSRVARLLVAGAAVALLPTAGASAQDCVAVAPGSSIGEPVVCDEVIERDDKNDDVEVKGEVVEREPAPAPEPEAAPALAATGASSTDLALTGAAALAAGGAMVMAARRKRVEA